MFYRILSISLRKQDLGPTGSVALALSVAAGEDEAAVLLQAHGVAELGAYGNDVRPVCHILEALGLQYVADWRPLASRPVPTTVPSIFTPMM